MIRLISHYPKILFFTLLTSSIVLTQEPDDDSLALDLDAMWEKTVWEEIQDVVDVGYEVEKVTAVAGVLGAEDDSMRQSIGFGILWDTAIGPLSFYWADPVSNQTYDKLREFQFTIGTRL